MGEQREKQRNSLSSLVQRLQIAIYFNVDLPWKKKKSWYETPRIDFSHKLPKHILSQIFLYSVLSTINPATFPCIEPNPRQGPLCVSQVSRKWRDAALDTPQLWSSIYVGRNGNLSLLKLWISRSRDEPLGFQLKMGFHEELMQKHPTLSTQIVDLFAGEIHRWEQVGFATGLPPATDLQFTTLNLSQAIIMRKLSIHITDRRSFTTGFKSHVELLDCLPSLPALESLAWTSMYHPALVLHPTWSLLSHIRMSTGLELDEAYNFLAQCTSAIEIQLDCITTDFFDVTHSHVLLPNLRVLRITDSACDFTSMLKYFTCPSLEILQFQSINTQPESSKHLEMFIRRSSSPLRQLSVVDYTMNQGVFLHLISSASLEKIPSLGLCTRRQVKWDYFMEELAFRLASSERKLEHCEDSMLGGWVGWGSSGKDLVEVHSRFLLS